MSCVCCFCLPDYQKNLKAKTFKENRFEKRLDMYKQIYMEEIDSLMSVNFCDCKFATDNKKYPLFVSVTDQILITLKTRKTEISDFFCNFEKIYIDYISNGPFNAINVFSDFLNIENLLSSFENALGYNQLLFRARERGRKRFNELDLFHVPFTARCKISNQRFSISGQPMLYLAKSIITAEKELDKKFNSLEFSAFLPNYSIYYNAKIYNLSFSLFDSIKNLPALCAAGAKGIGNNSEIWDTVVKRDILTNILTFPLSEEKKSFIEEYSLPQMFTSIIEGKGYIGISYPSAKMNFDIKDQHIYSDYDKNIAFFVKYQSTIDYDKLLKNSFIQFLLPFKFHQRIMKKISVEFVKKQLKEIKAPDAEKNYNDWLVPISKASLHIEYLEKAKISGKLYFSTKEGQMELLFILELIKKMKEQIKIQQGIL